MDFNEPSWQHESTVCASLRVVAESCVRSHAQTQEQNNKTNHLDKTLLKFLQPQILLSPENIYNINALKIIAGSNQSCPLVWVFTRPPPQLPVFLSLPPPSDIQTFPHPVCWFSAGMLLWIRDRDWLVEVALGWLQPLSPPSPQHTLLSAQFVTYLMCLYHSLCQETHLLSLVIAVIFK